MKITKEELEALIREAVTYDQPTGLKVESLPVFTVCIPEMRKRYRVGIELGKNYTHITFRFDITDSAVFYSVEDEHIGEYLVDFEPLELNEKPYSLMILVRTLYYKALQNIKRELDHKWELFHKAVLYED